MGEGIHLGAMAGTLDLVQRGLTGLETREDALWLDPVPLPALSEYGFSLRYRSHWGVSVRLQSGQLRIGVPDSEESPIRVVLADRAVTIAPGETCTLVRPQAGGAGPRRSPRPPRAPAGPLCAAPRSTPPMTVGLPVRGSPWWARLRHLRLRVAAERLGSACDPLQPIVQGRDLRGQVVDDLRRRPCRAVRSVVRRPPARSRQPSRRPGRPGWRARPSTSLVRGAGSPPGSGNPSARPARPCAPSSRKPAPVRYGKAEASDGYVAVSALSHPGLIHDRNEDSPLVVGPWTLCATVTENPRRWCSRSVCRSSSRSPTGSADSPAARWPVPRSPAASRRPGLSSQRSAGTGRTASSSDVTSVVGANSPPPAAYCPCLSSCRTSRRFCQCSADRRAQEGKPYRPCRRTKCAGVSIRWHSSPAAVRRKDTTCSLPPGPTGCTRRPP